MFDVIMMDNWKREVKRLKALNGEKVIFIEYHRYKTPNGKVSMQIGDGVPAANERLRGTILGTVLKPVDLDELREHSQSHSDYCGTEEVKKWEVTDEEWRKDGES
ncbi:hypothetical protein EV360DRAFT_73022 [Lentinula raphanica]|nr:hypothetical protein EV360DRAFT_73022 [Lentinula raphanica]